MADLDGFYNKKIYPADRIRTHNAYERVIVDDVFDFARRECSCHRVAISGASLGAYHGLRRCHGSSLPAGSTRAESTAAS